MHKRFIIIWAVLLFTGTASGQSSRIVQEVHTGRIIKGDHRYSVYLPAGYDESLFEYPVLYLLHDETGDHKSWIDQGGIQEIADSLIRCQAIRPLVIIMPEASRVPDKDINHMGYFNQPGWYFEDYFIKEFIANIEKRYRIKSGKGSRAVSGNSMGGGGAVIMGSRHSELFIAVGCLSPVFDKYERLGLELGSVFRGTAAKYFPSEYSLGADTDKISRMKSVAWRLWCGDNDILLDESLRFLISFFEAGVSVEASVSSGAHDWEFWKRNGAELLTWISERFE